MTGTNGGPRRAKKTIEAELRKGLTNPDDAPAILKAVKDTFEELIKPIRTSVQETAAKVTHLSETYGNTPEVKQAAQAAVEAGEAVNDVTTSDSPSVAKVADADEKSQAAKKLVEKAERTLEQRVSDLDERVKCLEDERPGLYSRIEGVETVTSAFAVAIANAFSGPGPIIWAKKVFGVSLVVCVIVYFAIVELSADVEFAWLDLLWPIGLAAAGSYIAWLFIPDTGVENLQTHAQAHAGAQASYNHGDPQFGVHTPDDDSIDVGPGQSHAAAHADARSGRGGSHAGAGAHASSH